MGNADEQTRIEGARVRHWRMEMRGYFSPVFVMRVFVFVNVCMCELACVCVRVYVDTCRQDWQNITSKHSSPFLCRECRGGKKERATLGRLVFVCVFVSPRPRLTLTPLRLRRGSSLSRTLERIVISFTRIKPKWCWKELPNSDLAFGSRVTKFLQTRRKVLKRIYMIDIYWII